MATGWVSEAWLLAGSQDGFLRHGCWMGFRVLAAGWVPGWVCIAAGSLDGFLRHGHWVGFRGMAAGSLDGVILSTGRIFSRILEGGSHHGALPTPLWG